jgi:hypothetical protein
MNIQSFGTIKVSILGFPLGSLGEKWHLDVVPMERHRVHYREGSGASSQRLQTMWSLCLRLSLLNSPHHFHSTCTNHIFLLIMQVVLISSRNSSTPSSLKCYKLRSVPQLFSSFVILFWNPPLGLLKNFFMRWSLRWLVKP